MIANIDIINIALNLLGMESLTGITGNSPSEKVMSILFEPARDDLLSESPWSFALVKESLVNVDDTVLELEWSYIYVRPTKALTVWTIYNVACLDTKWEQEFEGAYQTSLDRRVLCSNLEEAYTEYTYSVTDPNMFSKKFVLALAYKLAALAAPQLLRDSKTSEVVTNMANLFISQAKVLSHKEKLKVQKVTSSYKEAR